MQEKHTLLQQRLEQAFAHLPNVILTNWKDEITMLCNSDDIPQIFRKLKNQLHFNLLLDICGADYITQNKSLEIIYHLLNIADNTRLRVKSKISMPESNTTPTIQSISSIYSSASWYERETYDMYGIKFTNHKDMRRILTDYNFQGFPMRKDFPLSGNYELHFDEHTQSITKSDVQLDQQYREFDFNNTMYHDQKINSNAQVLPGDEKALTQNQSKAASKNISKNTNA